MSDDITRDQRASANELHSRRTLLSRSAVGLAAVAGAGTLAGPALANSSGKQWWHKSGSHFDFDFIVTQEQFGVTFLTEAVRRAPGTPSAQFLPVLEAANTTEFDHVTALEGIGAKPLTTSYWIPDAAFGAGGAGLFASIEAVETIEFSMYLIGVDDATRRSQKPTARLCAEAMATESEHRVLARFAQGALGATIGVPNNISFAPFSHPTMAAVKAALEALGIGYGRKGAGPGKFYDYPGDPVANGTGSVQDVRTPS
ncbi:MAG TPA: hypothetical protein VGK92_05655 [Gaiellales bacterium]|jgi:hypothetical protein